MYRFRHWVFAVVLVATTIGTAGAYDNDTHYVLTYYLARKVGFSVEQARQIASADVSVDVEPGTEPLQATQVVKPTGDAQTPRILFHAFPDTRLYDDIYARQLAAGASKTEADMKAKEVAKQRVTDRQKFLWERGLRSGNPGQFLHFYQDTFSHGIYWSSAGHSYAGHAPDFISAGLDDALRMAEGTVGRLQEFMKVCMQKESARVDIVEVQRVVRRLGEINPITRFQDRSPPVKDLRSAFEYLTSKVLKINGMDALADDTSSPNWQAAADYIATVLGEKLPEWINYSYPADGPSQDANWRVKGCDELPQDGELKAKVNDDKSGKPLSGAHVTLALGNGGPEANGDTVDGAYTFTGLKATDVTYRVQATLKGYQDGGAQIQFGCDGCGNVVAVRLKALPGRDEAEFAANLAREEAWIRERLERLKLLRDEAVGELGTALTAFSDALTRREMRPTAPGLPGKLEASAAELGDAEDACGKLDSGGQKLSAALARMEEEERQLEELLNNALTTAQLCAQPVTGNAERDYAQAQAVQQLIDQQQAALGLLDVQMSDLLPKRSKLLDKRARATTLLADAGRSLGPAIGVDPATLDSRLADLRAFSRDWTAGEKEKFAERLARFRADNGELVDPQTLAAGIARLQRQSDAVDGLALGGPEIARRAGLVDAAKGRLAALEAANRQGEAAFAALQKSVAAATCLDAAAPDMRGGLASAESTRFMAQLASDKFGPAVVTAIKACKNKPRTNVDHQTQIAAATCWPGSEAYWNDTRDTVGCRCLAGRKWNADRTACLTDKPDPALNALLSDMGANQGQADAAHRGERAMAAEQHDKAGMIDGGPSLSQQGAQNQNLPDFGAVLGRVVGAVAPPPQRPPPKSPNSAKPSGDQRNDNLEACIQCVNGYLNGSCYARIPTLAGWGLCISCTPDGGVEPQNRFIDRDRCPVCQKAPWHLENFKAYKHN